MYFFEKGLKKACRGLERDFELGFEFKKPPFFGGLFWSLSYLDTTRNNVIIFSMFFLRLKSMVPMV
jgi:hypothetical protein